MAVISFTKPNALVRICISFEQTQADDPREPKNSDVVVICCVAAISATSKSFAAETRHTRMDADTKAIHT